MARDLDLAIIPLSAPHTDDVNCLIVFREVSRVLGDTVTLPHSVKPTTARLIAQLREDLALTRDHLQASLTEQESVNESLRATLEELQSTNEELRVTNEELETGKEELRKLQ